jgi:hypothetical protein
MSSVMNTAGGAPRPGWLGKIETYANRAADAMLDTLGPIAESLEDSWKSVVRHLLRKPH